MIRRYKQLFFRVSVIFSLLVTIVILFAWYKNAEPSIKLVAMIYLCASIVLPIFIILVGWISETYFKRQMELVFNKPPLLDMQSDKFNLVEIESKSKWFASSFVLNGKVNGYNGFFVLLHDELIKVQVTFPFYPIDKAIRSKIETSLNRLDFKVYNDNICKTYGKNKLLNMTYEELSVELETATTTLREENIITTELAGANTLQ